MAFFDFLTGGQPQDPNAQGLPPEHSTAARLMELLGGITGFRPLSAIGQMVDQSTIDKFNEAYWPKFKNQMAQAGIPQQHIDMLDSMPIAQRTAYANEMMQAALKSTKPEKQDLMSWWRSEHPKGTAEQYESFIGQGKLSDKIPTTDQAEAMALGGTTDMSQLAQHPELLVQAHNKDYAQQRQIAADTSEAERKNMMEFAQQFKQPKDTRDRKQVLLDKDGHPTGVIDLDTLAISPIAGGTNYFKTTPKTASDKVNEYQDFRTGYLKTHPSAGGDEIYKAYKAAGREPEDQKLADFQKRVDIQTRAAMLRGDAESTRKLKEIKAEIAAGYKLPPESRQQKLDDLQKREDIVEQEAEKRQKAAAALKSKGIENPYTMSNFLTDRKKAMDQAKMELTRPGLISKGIPSGPAIMARANDLLASKGVNPFTGKKLQNGEKVKLSDGRIVTWSDK